MSRENILLMTSTIAPPDGTFALSHADPELRIEDYRRSLNFYLSYVEEGIFDRLVYVDNSGWPLSMLESIASDAGLQERCEFISYTAAGSPDFSRYYLEANLLLEALARSHTLKQTAEATTWKVTGRYIIENIDEIVAAQPGEFDLYLNLRNHPYQVADFYLIGYRGDALQRLLAKRPEDFKSRKDGEIVLREKIDAGEYRELNIVPRLRHTPRLRGTRGFDGTPYEGKSYVAKYHFRALMNKITPWWWI